MPAATKVSSWRSSSKEKQKGGEGGTKRDETLASQRETRSRAVGTTRRDFSRRVDRRGWFPIANARGQRTVAPDVVSAALDNGLDGVHGGLAVARGRAAGVGADKGRNGRQDDRWRHAHGQRAQHLCGVEVHGCAVIVVVVLQCRRDTAGSRLLGVLGVRLKVVIAGAKGTARVRRKTRRNAKCQTGWAPSERKQASLDFKRKQASQPVLAILLNNAPL